MILEAFSHYLLSQDQELPASLALANWLWERLAMPAQGAVDQVIHCEVLIGSTSGKDSLRERELLELVAGQGIHRENADEFFKIRLPKEAEKALDYKKAVGTRTCAYYFRGASPSGERLLKSLYEYCMSLEQQKWARFLHSLKASDFHTQ